MIVDQQYGYLALALFLHITMTSRQHSMPLRRRSLAMPTSSPSLIPRCGPTYTHTHTHTHTHT